MPLRAELRDVLAEAVEAGDVVPAGLLGGVAILLERLAVAVAFWPIGGDRDAGDGCTSGCVAGFGVLADAADESDAVDGHVLAPDVRRRDRPVD